jgi:serine/threonine protein kinase
VVHSDLKPANVMLIRDKTIVAGYRVKIIDMDFSLLADRRAPWHGDRGYFGTPGYLSPEHLRGEVPCAASDVFTLGLMLYELIGDGHPYRFEDEQKYREAVLAHAAKPPGLIRPLADRVNAGRIRELIHACLSPDPKDRPEAITINLALNSRAGEEEPVPVILSEEPDRPLVMLEFEAEKPAEARPLISGRLKLGDGDGHEKVFNVTTTVGRVLLREFGPDSRFADEAQFRLEKTEIGWMIVPEIGTSNETMLNGRRLEVATPLCDGDAIGVGRESKGVVKLTLTARPG